MPLNVAWDVPSYEQENPCLSTIFSHFDNVFLTRNSSVFLTFIAMEKTFLITKRTFYAKFSFMTCFYVLTKL